MRKVRYIPNGTAYKRLTIGKVYDIIEYVKGFEDDYIRVLNDEGVVDHFYVFTYNGVPEFVDITHVFRNEIIDEILE